MTQPARTADGAVYRSHPSIFREYDIRGIVGDTLFEADALAIGYAFGTECARQTHTAPTMVVARDGRLSSPALHGALCRGLLASGARVVDAGVGPTPLLYFAAQHLKADAGIMVTGSHNPPTHNGFKMVMRGASFFGSQIAALAQTIAGQVMPALTDAAPERVSVTDAYLAALAGGMRAGGRALSVAWDPGNGAAGEVVAMLSGQLAGVHHAINTTIDGTFPAHHPDPSVPANLKQLMALVAEKGCDVGLAFDGDGDRLGVVDDKGRIVSPDHLLMLLARDVLSGSKGTIIADVKTSQTFFDDVARHGGQPMMYKTGHSHIKTKMKEISAPFAGEASGHIFFADRYFGFDDGIYAGVRLLNLLAQQDAPLSALLDALPVAFSTPEIRLPCPDERKFAVVDEVKARLVAEGADFTDIDGVRVTTPDGWWLIRASNTQAVINARCEAGDEASLTPLVAALAAQLAQSGIILPSLDDLPAAH